MRGAILREAYPSKRGSGTLPNPGAKKNASHPLKREGERDRRRERNLILSHVPERWIARDW